MNDNEVIYADAVHAAYLALGEDDTHDAAEIELRVARAKKIIEDALFKLDAPPAPPKGIK